MAGFFDTVFPNVRERAEKREFERAQRAMLLGQQGARATLLGGYDPETEITWETGRQGMMPDQTRAVGAQAFPEAAEAAARAKMFPAQLAPVKVGAGETLGVPTLNQATGQYDFDPLYTGPRNEELTPWQKLQATNQDRQFNITQSRIDSQDARAAAEAERRNRPQATPYVSALSGNPVRMDPATQSYMDGEEVVSSADLIPAADFTKQVDKGRVIAGGLTQAQSILDEVTNNKTAFDADRVNTARMRSRVPFYGDQMAAGVFTPEENTLRAKVARESAMIINELYGAALSAGESTRAATFAPNPEDTIDMLIPKLNAAVDWAKTQEKGIIPGASKRARSQLGIKNPVSVPDGAIAALKANPSRRADFEKKYGPGSAEKYLGKTNG
jgi:hypothetical protein